MGFDVDKAAEIDKVLNNCLNRYWDFPLLIPAKTIALGTSHCLKKAYFMMMVDNLPGSHIPYKLVLDGQVIHDALAYLVIPFTKRFLESQSTGNLGSVDKLVDEAWDEIGKDVEDYSNTYIDYQKIRPALVSMIRGYAAVIGWLVKYGKFHSDGILVFPERMIINKPTVDVLASPSVNEFLPLIGVPDVVIIDRRGRRAAVIDWKIYGGVRNELHYIQLLLYKKILEKILDGEVYSFLIYTTEKKGKSKVVSIERNVNLGEFGVDYDTRSVSDRLQRAIYVAQLLYSMAFCRNILGVAGRLVKERGIKIPIFNPERGAGRRNYPCNWCQYKTLCKYRFAKTEQLSEEEVKLRRGFGKLYKIALENKSEEYKNLINFNECINFDKMEFIRPNVVRLEKRFGKKTKVLSSEIMRYSLGRTTAYLFGGDDPMRGAQTKGAYSPLLFGRYEDDSVEVRHVGDGVELAAELRMISPVFALRWLPLYTYYKYRPNDGLFRNVTVCKGEVPMNIELRAIATVEAALVDRFNNELKEWWSEFVKDLVISAVDEYV